jgi:hypothetical protein
MDTRRRIEIMQLAVIAGLWLVAWIVVAAGAPLLWPVALVGFLQNVSFTLVSRGRNSGSLAYHAIASVFSNGIYAALLFINVDIIAGAKTGPVTFLVVYTATTLSGSVFAHWLALRMEKGRARSVQEDRVAKLERRLADAETGLERLDRIDLGRRVRDLARERTHPAGYDEKFQRSLLESKARRMNVGTVAKRQARQKLGLAVQDLARDEYWEDFDRKVGK